VKTLFTFIKRIAHPLIIPATLLALSSFLVWTWPIFAQKLRHTQELRAFFAALPLVPYAFFSAGLLMGCRYNNMGLSLASLALAASYAISLNWGPHGTMPARIPQAVTFLLPLNLAYFSLLVRRSLFSRAVLFSLGMILLQAFALFLLCFPLNFSHLTFLSKMGELSSLTTGETAHHASKIRAALSEGGLINASTASLMSFSAATIFLSIGFLRRKSVLWAGFLGAAFASHLGMAGGGSDLSITIHFSAAILMLMVVTMETSFSMAYTDELTGLPGRRSLNEALSNLGKKYVIAMVDIDHFKKFNDRYGHKTGDQALKMVAATLGRMSGGAKIFRYGGEEFSVVFPGKTMEEALPHLEKCRHALGKDSFTVRGKGRRKRDATKRSENKRTGQKNVRITASIGVAANRKTLKGPYEVLKEADKMLYKAKKAGRNRTLCRRS
jgi:diguanylate cyclase (GGDEF)-like protein